MRTVERIANEDEDGFASMKRYINREVRDWFHRQKGKGQDGGAAPKLAIDILIEQMCDDSKHEVDLLSDLELDW